VVSSIVVLGTSNSILRDGWVHGFKAFPELTFGTPQISALLLRTKNFANGEPENQNIQTHKAVLSDSDNQISAAPQKSAASDSVLKLNEWIQNEVNLLLKKFDRDSEIAGTRISHVIKTAKSPTEALNDLGVHFEYADPDFSKFLKDRYQHEKSLEEISRVAPSCDRLSQKPPNRLIQWTRSVYSGLVRNQQSEESHSIRKARK